MGKDSGGRVTRQNILVGVCYRPSKEDEGTDEVFCGELGEVSCLVDLVLMRDFSKQEKISSDIQQSKEETV